MTRFLSTFLLICMASTQAHADSCLLLNQFIEFCDRDNFWVQSPSRHPHALAEFTLGNEINAQIIFERAGTDNGLSLSAAREAIVEMARRGIPGTSTEFSLLLENPAQNTGEDWSTIVYSVELHGIPYIFANSYYVGDTYSVQAVTFRVSAELSEKDRAAHLSFGRAISLRQE